MKTRDMDAEAGIIIIAILLGLFILVYIVIDRPGEVRHDRHGNKIERITK